MHYGNLKFKQKQREEQAEPDGTEGIITTIDTETLTATGRVQGPWFRIMIHVMNPWFRVRIMDSICIFSPDASIAAH